MTLLFSLLVAVGIGAVALSLVHGDLATIRYYPWLCLWLSLGFGLGISSMSLFIWSVLLYPSAGYILAELCLVVALTVPLIYRVTTKPLAAPSQTPPGASLRSGRLSPLQIFFYVLLISSLLSFAFLFTAGPHGVWDAWAVWNLRARFIFLGGEHWLDGFSGALRWSHPDYPLLLPALVARAWIYTGQNSVVAPALVATLFTFATLGLLVSSLGIFRGKTQGLIAGIVLMGTPFFFEHGASQQADIPIGFYILATLVLVCLAEHKPSGKNSWMILAGAMAGFSAWTKNEGLLFLTSVFAVRLAITAVTKERTGGASQWLFFPLGLLPMLVTVSYLKLWLAPFEDPLLTQGWQAIAKLGNLSRYLQVWQAFQWEPGSFRNWVVPLALAFYALLMGKSAKSKERQAVGTAAGALLLVLIGYFLVYVVTPWDLDWYVKTSQARLLMQLWPSIVFVFFLIVRAPDEAAGMTRQQSFPGLGRS